METPSSTQNSRVWNVNYDAAASRATSSNATSQSFTSDQLYQQSFDEYGESNFELANFEPADFSAFLGSQQAGMFDTKLLEEVLSSGPRRSIPPTANTFNPGTPEIVPVTPATDLTQHQSPTPGYPSTQLVNDDNVPHPNTISDGVTPLSNFQPHSLHLSPTPFPSEADLSKFIRDVRQLAKKLLCNYCLLTGHFLVAKPWVPNSEVINLANLALQEASDYFNQKRRDKGLFQLQPSIQLDKSTRDKVIYKTSKQTCADRLTVLDIFCQISKRSPHPGGPNNKELLWNESRHI